MKIELNFTHTKFALKYFLTNILGKSISLNWYLGPEISIGINRIPCTQQALNECVLMSELNRLQKCHL